MQKLDYAFLNKLKALPFVDAVYLFGSRARGDNRERSDIDLAIKLSSTREQHDWLKVINIIDEADTLLEIDCVNLDDADEKFRTRILSEGQLL